MKILVIDGQGGQLGGQLIKTLKENLLSIQIMAVGQADAVRILLPMNRCDNLVAGLSEISMTEILQDVLVRVKTIYEERT